MWQCCILQRNCAHCRKDISRFSQYVFWIILASGSLCDYKRQKLVFCGFFILLERPCHVKV